MSSDKKRSDTKYLEPKHISTPIVSPEQWQNISTVLLDMDGTLLDLCFDDTLWRTQLPLAYCEHHGVSLAVAEKFISNIADNSYGKLDWYCVDFWSEQLGFDIRPQKHELKHLIGFRPGALAFLKWLNHQGKQVILATNAHPASISLKDAQTDLCTWVDQVLHAHEVGMPKEEQGYWTWLQNKTGYIGSQTLFIDDNDHILDSAKEAGIEYCLGVTSPNSQLAPKKSRYPAFDHFQDVYPLSI